MNKKVGYAILGVTAAAAIGYYFYAKNKSNVASLPNILPPSSSGGSVTSPQSASPAGTPATSSPTCQYTEGQLLRAKDKVYYIDAACTKHYVSGGIYSKYGFRGGDIKQVTQGELDSIPEGNALQGLSGLKGKRGIGLSGYLLWE